VPVDDGPLIKPAHLAPGGHAAPGAGWLVPRIAGLATLALGLIAFVLVAVTQRQVLDQPDWRISVPCFVATAIAAAGSLARREHAHALVLGGLGLAAAALVLGWFMLLAIVIAALIAVILVLHAVL